MKKFTAEELKKFLFEEKTHYLHTYFSLEPLDGLLANAYSDDKGIYIDRDIWRKGEIVDLSAPLTVAVAGLFYSMNFCSEYVDAGHVKAKSGNFCSLAKKV